MISGSIVVYGFLEDLLCSRVGCGVRVDLFVGSVWLQLRSWSANFEPVCLRITGSEHIVNWSEVEGSGPLKTEPKGNQMVVGIFFRSVSRYSNGRIRVEHHDLESFLHLHRCTSSEESVLRAGTVLVAIRHQRRLQRLNLFWHTAWPQKLGKSHPNEPVPTSTEQFACQWFDMSWFSMVWCE